MDMLPQNRRISQEIKIYDSTLRDGEQMPGVVFTQEEKVNLALNSSEFGANIIDIMPAISEKERLVAEMILDMGLSAELTAATMLRKEHLDIASEMGASRVILFSSLSDIHLDRKMNISRRDNLNKSLELVEYANELGLTVDFAGEDSTRADFNYVIDFINALSGKIEYFLPCDTLGTLTPSQTYTFIKNIKKQTHCKIGLHIHNDYGQATACTLAGLEAGADLFSGTFNGIGERSGNAPIEEVVMALKMQYGVDLGLKYQKIGEICSLVEKYSKIKLQPHKPISGVNAFSHESGIHVDGLLKYSPNYENFDPSIVGQKRNILFGKHSGKSGLRHLFGNSVSEDSLIDMLNKIKEKSEQNKRSFSEEEILHMFAKFPDSNSLMTGAQADKVENMDQIDLNLTEFSKGNLESIRFREV